MTELISFFSKQKSRSATSTTGLDDTPSFVSTVVTMLNRWCSS
jgi:hypothetical protein